MRRDYFLHNAYFYFVIIAEWCFIERFVSACNKISSDGEEQHSVPVR